MIYEVYICGRKVKEYPHRIQAVIYLILKGFAYRCRYGCWISPEAEIKEIN